MDCGAFRPIVPCASGKRKLKKRRKPGISGVDHTIRRSIKKRFLERFAKANFAGHCDLVGRNAALEKVSEFLDILEVHE